MEFEREDGEILVSIFIDDLTPEAREAFIKAYGEEVPSGVPIVSFYVEEPGAEPEDEDMEPTNE
jgi:hypothetical protein